MFMSSGEGLKLGLASFAHRSPVATIPPRHVGDMAIIHFQSFADSSRGGIAEKHMPADRGTCILLNLSLSLAAVGCTLQ